MDAGHLVSVAVGAILVNNLVLARFLGLCPLLRRTGGVGAAAGLGLAATVAITLAAAATFAANSLVLVPLGVPYLETVVFVVVCFAVVRSAGWLSARYLAGFHRSAGVYMPSLATTCAVVGVALLNAGESLGFGAAVANAAAAGVGFALVLVLLRGLGERVELAPVPRSLEGLPVSLILTGLVAMAFLGFSGLAME